MGGLFGHHASKPKPQAAPKPAPAPTQSNGAAIGASQNYGNQQNVLSGQSQIARGSFLGS